MSEGPPIEVIGQGREPDRLRPPRRPLPRGVGASGYVLVAALGAGAIWLTARPGPAPARPGAQPVPLSSVVEDPTVGQFVALPAHHDLAVSTAPAERSFIAFGGHVLLFLTVTYTGPAPAQVVDGRVPQGGAYPDAGAGGLTAGTTENVQLRPRVPTEVFVRTRVDCGAVLVGSAADHLDITTQAGTAASRNQVIDLTPLGTYWDEARHAACTRADARTAVTATVTRLHGSPASGGRRAWVEAGASLHNSSGFDAVVAITSDSPPGLSLAALAMTSAGAAIDGGSTYLTPVRWTISDCAAAQQSPPPMLPMSVELTDTHAQVDGALGASFGDAWQIALLQACS